MALLATMQGGGKILFGFFAACGLYLALARPRSWRAAPLGFTLTLGAWALWQIGLSLARGEPLDGNRVLSYAGIELALALLPLGLTLVRRPIDALATGARIGLLLASVLSVPLFLVSETGRVGLGANEAIFAFVIGVAGLAARLPARCPWRWLPNGPAWTYLAALPIALSGTRAALVLVLLALAVDAPALVRRHAGSQGRRRTRALVVAGLAALALAVPLGVFAWDRVERGLAEMERFEETGRAAGSVDTRFVMIGAGLSVLAENPLLGVGGTRRMEAAAQAAGSNGFMVIYYQHLHNFVLDEALSSGLVGVALMLSVFTSFLLGVFRSTAGPIVKTTSLLLVAFLAIFGSFHGVLLNEWTLIALFGTMGCIVATLRREERRG